MNVTSQKPNGPVAAALLAGGIGPAILGLVTLIQEMSPTSAFATSLKWWGPVGPLSGKTGLAIIGYFAAWLVFYILWRKKDVKFNRVGILAMVLLAVGLIGTFPPFWQLITGG